MTKNVQIIETSFPKTSLTIPSQPSHFFSLYLSTKSPICIHTPPNNCPPSNHRHAIKANCFSLISPQMQPHCGHSDFSAPMLYVTIFPTPSSSTKKDRLRGLKFLWSWRESNHSHYCTDSLVVFEKLILGRYQILISCTILILQTPSSYVSPCSPLSHQFLKLSEVY